MGSELQPEHLTIVHYTLNNPFLGRVVKQWKLKQATTHFNDFELRQSRSYLRGGRAFQGEAGSKLPDIANALCSSLSLIYKLRSQNLRPSPVDGAKQ